MNTENGEKKSFMRDFLEGLEKYDTSQSSSEKRGVSLIINGEPRGTIENFVCHLSQDNYRGDIGRLNLGFSDSSIGAEEVGTVILIIRLRIKKEQEIKEVEFVFPLKYVGTMRCWLLGEYRARKHKAQEEQEVEEEQGSEEKKDWFPGITCYFSRELRDNLDRAVANGAVRIEVRMKKEEV